MGPKDSAEGPIANERSKRMALSDVAKGRLAYGWQWLWLAMVASASAWCYLELVELISSVVWGLPALSSLEGATDDVVVTVVKAVTGVLFCWRVVKVAVLHGSPIPWGMELSSGRENGGVSGRPVHMASIAGGGKAWFGVVMRAHAASDKLMRTRLEFLMVALPFGRGLMVSESRVYWISRAEQDKRHQYFVRHAGKYWKTSESKSPDQFRRDVVRHLDEMAKPLRNGKRIDGLTWQFALGKTFYVRDDFGYALTCERLDGERYTVKGRGSDDGEATTVDSLDALRDLVKQELHPVYR